MTLECQKKSAGKHTIKWSLHLLVRSTEHLASAESIVFDVENRRDLAISIWVGERDDHYMISLVGSKARCNKWQATSCPALRICKDEIHMSGKMWSVRNHTTGKQRIFNKTSPSYPGNETWRGGDLHLWVGDWRGMMEETESRGVIYGESSYPLTYRSQDSCLRRKCFILGMAVSSVLNNFPPVFESVHTINASCMYSTIVA